MVNERKQMVLVYDNNIFHVNRRNADKIFWKCIEYRKCNCKCRLVVSKGGLITRPPKPHNHPPNTEKIRKKTSRYEYLSTPFDLTRSPVLHL